MAEKRGKKTHFSTVVEHTPSKQPYDPGSLHLSSLHPAFVFPFPVATTCVRVYTGNHDGQYRIVGKHIYQSKVVFEIDDNRFDGEEYLSL